MKSTYSILILMWFSLSLFAAEDVYLERTSDTGVKMRSSKKISPARTFDNGDLQIEVISSEDQARIKEDRPVVSVDDESSELKAWRRLAEEPIELRVKDGRLYIQWAGDRQVQNLISNMVVRIRLKPKIKE